MTTDEKLTESKRIVKKIIDQIPGARERNPEARISTKEVLEVIMGRYDEMSINEKKALAILFGGKAV